MNETDVNIAIPWFWILLATTVLISLYSFRRRDVMEALLLHPWSIMRKKQYYRLLSYGLIHADMLHLLFNMIAMYSVSLVLEQAMGSTRFILLYLGAMVLAAGIPAWRHRDNPGYSALGASGAVSALFFAGMLYFPTAKVMVFLLPVPLPWPVFAILFIVVSIIGGRRNWGNIGHDVHLYGALSGLGLTILLDPGVVDHFLSTIGALMK